MHHFESLSGTQTIINKKAGLENLDDSTKADLIIGNESWLHIDIQLTEVSPSGFTFYRKDCKTDAHGGVSLLVADKYLGFTPSDLMLDDKVSSCGSSCK